MGGGSERLRKGSGEINREYWSDSKGSISPDATLKNATLASISAS